MTRRLHGLGARVLGVDQSEAMLSHARRRGPAEIEYRLVDATDPAALRSLGRFDAVVCSMAFMDIADLGPLLGAMKNLLERGGRLVAALTHPCFNFHGSRLFLEHEDRQGQIVESTGVRVTNYLREAAVKGAGAPGEPNPHTYYHRPLHRLVGSCFAAGLVLDGLEERAFEHPLEGRVDLNWSRLNEVPPLLALRLRLGTSREPGPGVPLDWPE
jgi:SAM-dependent methyltransferase